MRYFFIRMKILAAAWMIMAIGAASCDLRHNEISSERAMPEFAEELRPFCIGRLAIHIPSEAEIRAISQSIEGFGKIKVHPGMTKGALLQMASRKEQELRVKPHRKEGTVLRDVVELDDSRILIFRDDDINTLDYEMLGFFWKEGTGYVFNRGAGNDHVEASKADLHRSIHLISSRSNDEFPSAAGFCIDNAIVSGSEFRAERAGVKFTVPSLPGLEIGVQTSGVSKPYPEDLITRSDQNLPAVRALHPDASLKTLRKGKRDVANFTGQEIVELVNHGEPDELFLAAWEFPGEVKSVTRPSINISMDYSREANAAVSGARTISEEELIAFWDALLASLRLREVHSRQEHPLP